jgi:hypothetical protein
MTRLYTSANTIERAKTPSGGLLLSYPSWICKLCSYRFSLDTLKCNVCGNERTDKIMWMDIINLRVVDSGEL